MTKSKAAFLFASQTLGNHAFEQKLPKHLKYRSRPRLLISHLGEFVRLSCARVTNLRFGDALQLPSGEVYACLRWRVREPVWVRMPGSAEDYFGASEATIVSKRGSPRRGSHSGCRRK
jgi:hypothetical protein